MVRAKRVPSYLSCTSSFESIWCVNGVIFALTLEVTREKDTFSTFCVRQKDSQAPPGVLSQMMYARNSFWMNAQRSWNHELHEGACRKWVTIIITDLTVIIQVLFRENKMWSSWYNLTKKFYFCSLEEEAEQHIFLFKARERSETLSLTLYSASVQTLSSVLKTVFALAFRTASSSLFSDPVVFYLVQSTGKS